VSLSLLLPACDSANPTPIDVSGLPVGLSDAKFAATLLAPPGDERGGRLRATLRLRVDRDLPPRSTIVLDQGVFDGDRRFRGPELRYALPEPGPDSQLSILAIEGGRRCSTRALRRIDGWFAIDLQDGLPGSCALELDLDVPANPLPLELELFAEVHEPGELPRPLPGRVHVRLVDSRVDWLRVLAPAQAATGEPFELHVLFMDGLSGPQSTARDSLIPAGHLELVAPTGSFSVALAAEADGDPRLPHAVVVTLPPQPPGIHRVAARWREKPDVVGLSNPIRVGDSGPACWFGTLHAHTAVGGHASGTPTGALRYARDVSRLDFVALSEHRESPWFDGEWLRGLAQDFTTDGRFVVLNGCEWTDPDWGHRHLLFREPVAPPAAPTDLADLATTFGHREDVLLVAHHPIWNGLAAQRRFVWGAPDDLPRQRLAEVYSWHGSSLEHDSPFPFHGNAEQTLPREWRTDILSALRAGHRLFLVADGDNHLGKPGALVGIEWPKGRRYAFQGLTGVLAPALERTSLFAAIDRGDVFGTTGARIVVEATREAARARLRIAATAPLQRVAVRPLSGDVVERRYEASTPTRATEHARHYADPAAGTFDASVEFELAAACIEQPWIVEVAQHDFHHAWRLLPPPSWAR
jgi:hypothetical protein